MPLTIHVDIVSAEAAIFSGLAQMVFAPAAMGEVGIAPRHSPMITHLKPGEVIVRRDNGDEEAFYVSGGILEIQPHVITILSDTAMRAKDLDEASALESQREAEHQLEQSLKDMDLAKAQAQLAEAAAQLQAIQRLRKRSPR